MWRNLIRIKLCCNMEVWQRNISFFCLIFLFIWANTTFYILMTSNSLRSNGVSDFCHQLLLKLSRVRRKRNKKAWFQGHLSKMFGGTLFSVKTLTHCKTDLKHAVTMPLHQEYCLICIYWCKKFYCPIMRGSWVVVA